MIDMHFVVLGAVITLGGGAGYALDTLRGRTQPNRVSWVMWTLAPLVAFAAEIVQHVGLEALLTFAVGIGPLLVVVASFVDPRAYWQLTGFDVGCGLLSVTALALWAVTGKGDVAIALSIAADLFAAIPTIRKAYRHPESESANAFVAGALGAGITLLTIKPRSWAFASYAFPVYILLGASAVSVLIIASRPRIAVAASSLDDDA
jgi:hypothetical protein